VGSFAASRVDNIAPPLLTVPSDYLPRSSRNHRRATTKITVEHTRDTITLAPTPRKGWTKSSIIQPATDANKPAVSDGT